MRPEKKEKKKEKRNPNEGKRNQFHERTRGR
jgi:hypothetical protein